jgi:hypothetical protein
MPLEIADEVIEEVRTQIIQNRHPVSRAVAERLAERFGDATLGEVDRDRLQQVKGVGSATAREINPPRSEAYRAREKEAGPNALFPVWTDPERDDKLRLPEENPEHVRENVATAARHAATLRTYL